MTPQLQQAIKLLHMSTLEMQQEIQDLLDSNMMLETEDQQFAEVDSQGQETQSKKIEGDESVPGDSTEINIPDELPIASSWDNVYDNVQHLSVKSNADRAEIDATNSKETTLHDLLIEQLALLSLTDRDHITALFIIDSIDDAGYVTSSLMSIWQQLAEQFEDLDLDEVQVVLNIIQSFEPLGVAAIGLADCLRLQLLQLPETIALRDVAVKLVCNYLDLLVGQDKISLMRELNVSDSELTAIIALIRSLNPKPGLSVQSTHPEYVVPDVYVVWRNQQWHVDLNQDMVPKLRINPVYQDLIKYRDSSDDNVSMKKHLQEARWFIKSLHSRNDTILRVAECIVTKQQGFLHHGAMAMKPMVLKDIADIVKLHKSTISRVTTQKFMHTPNGVFEFKYFFSSHVSTTSGGDCSATAIRAFIKELINDENPAKPLSDNKIANVLNGKGINVARRTVAKYREAMLISPSGQRKRLL